MNPIKKAWLISCRSSVALLLLMVAQGILAQQTDPTAEGSTAEQRGKQHFVTYLCSSCHGFTGQGGQTDVAPRIRIEQLSADALAAYTRNPGGRMPPYRTELQIPDAALHDIHAYLKSLPASPAADDIPLLNQ